MPIKFETILEKNRKWVAQLNLDDPEYFSRLAEDHKPQFLFIGCSDARVPANVITQTAAGEMFVHRNVANMVVPTDTNLLAVIQYAIAVLGVSDIIVCGHYGCGGVRAAMQETDSVPPLVENWLAGIRTIARIHEHELDAIQDEEVRYQRLVELNVLEQVHNLSHTRVVRDAWDAHQPLRIHGVVYALNKGILHDLGVMTDSVLTSRHCRAASSQR